MSYNAAERETTINYDDGKPEAVIYTSSPVSLRKLDKLCSTNPESYNRIWAEVDKASGRITAARYIVADKKLIRFGRPASAAQRETARRNAVKMQSAR